jgi:hypothetical protein
LFDDADQAAALWWRLKLISLFASVIFYFILV